MDLTTIRNGLAARQANVAGLQPFARMPGNLDPPSSVVYPASPLYSVESMKATGAVKLNFLVVVYAPLGSDWDNAQQILDGYLSAAGSASSTTSVVDALLSTSLVNDSTLGGTIHISTVGDNYAVEQWGGDNGPVYMSASISLYLAMLRS